MKLCTWMRRLVRRRIALETPVANDAHNNLKSECYGYGRWDASYWFIGLEQGQSPLENDDSTLRNRAFLELNHDGLCDCEDFHRKIQELRWHRKLPKAKLQPTWRSLLLLLKSFEGKPSDLESLREYQRCRWGKSDGETCVIELSGAPSHNFKGIAVEGALLQKRLQFMDSKISACKPRFVVIYGKSQWDIWKKFWGDRLLPVKGRTEIFQLGPTWVAFTKSPTAFGVSNDHWIDLGRQLVEL